MTDPFVGIAAKLDRVSNQIDALKRAIGIFLEGDCYRPAFQFCRVRGTGEAPWAVDVSVRMVVKKPCPPEWSVIVGEIVHDLRSTLDHMVFSLAGSPSPAADYCPNQFPIRRKVPERPLRALSELTGVSDEAADLIEHVQPFATGEDAKSPLW